MFPKLITISIPEFLQGILPNSLTIYSYGFMIALGALVTTYLILYQSRHLGMDSDKIIWFLVWVILVSFIGGKLFFYLEDINKYMEDPSLLQKSIGSGFVFYGSLIFAIPTTLFWLKCNKIPIRPFLDVLSFSIPVLHSFGRMGCFLAGCCHGRVCDSWIGITFSHPDTAATIKGLPLYPTQFFDIVVNLMILLVLFFVRKKKSFDGQFFLIYLTLYAVGRSIVEHYRGDDERGFLFDGLVSHSQFIALIIVIICVLVWKRWQPNSSAS